MLNLRLSPEGNSFQGEHADHALRLGLVDFLEVEEGDKVVSFAVNTFLGAARQAVDDVPFALNQNEFLAALHAGEIQPNHIVDLARQLKVSTIISVKA